MVALLSRVEEGSDGPTIRRSGVKVAEVISRLEAGEAPDAIASALRLDPRDLIAALIRHALGPDESLGLPLVQARSTSPRLKGSCTETAIAGLFPTAARPARLALSAGLFQVLDFWNESHEAAQQADDLGERATSPYWHGIAHRREPDAGNASYWFRRVGGHPVFGPLVPLAVPLVKAVPQAGRLLRNGTWDPYAFIELCGSARAGSPEESAARRVQRLEMILLLDATIEPLVS